MQVKKVLMALAKAALYTLLFLIVQLAVSFAFAIAGGMGAAMQTVYDNGTPDVMALSEAMAEFILNNTMLITLVSNLLTVFLVWLIFALQKKNFLKEARIREIPSLAYAPLAIGGLCLAGLVSLIMALLPIPAAVWEEYAASSAALGDTGFVAIISTVLIAPIAEEIVFRGLVFTRLRRAMPAWAAAVLSSLIFGVMHGQIIWIAYAFVVGMIMCAVFERTGSVAATITLHAAFNLAGGYLFTGLELTGIFLIACAAGAVLSWIWLCRICPYTKLRPEEN